MNQGLRRFLSVAGAVVAIFVSFHFGQRSRNEEVQALEACIADRDRELNELAAERDQICQTAWAWHRKFYKVNDQMFRFLSERDAALAKLATAEAPETFPEPNDPESCK